jgi:CPA1 family monovalent cation:H+ antiporter
MLARDNGFRDHISNFACAARVGRNVEGQSMTLFDIVAVLLGLSAVFGFINYRFIGLPHAIGLVVMAMTASLAVILVDFAVPGLQISSAVRGTLRSVDFEDTLMNGMLSFLLFAGALHVDASRLASRKWSITAMATVGVLISTLIVGTVMWWGLDRLGFPIPFVWALVFGALISPTDPVAVLGILKTVHVPESLEAKIAGEALFNDGIGVVVFTIVLAVAMGSDHAALGALDVAKLFVLEAGGGAALGLVCGYVAYRAMYAIDEHNLEVLISLALVTVAYSIALAIHVSGPIAMVVAGLFIGNRGVQYAMSERTRDHLSKFWSLADEILNSVLFLLIGLEVLVVKFDAAVVGAALIAIPVVLAARWIAVAVPITVLSVRRTFTKGSIPVLTWGGLRGGISVALALSLPVGEVQSVILSITYSVVVFSIIVQGLTVKWVIGKTVK